MTALRRGAAVLGAALGVMLFVAASLVALQLSGSRLPGQREAPVPAAPVAAAPPAHPLAAGAPTDRIDRDWLERAAAATGIPGRALLAYASADLTVGGEQPGCGLGWNTIAAVGSIESLHGAIDGGLLGDDGHPAPAIRGLPLNGQGVAAIADTDGGVWDGDPVWDRAVGPMQFIPSTWAHSGADGNGDGVRDPNQIDDAALAAARYLCASGDVTTPENWRSAVFSYNHLERYVDDVAAVANRYSSAAGAL